MNLRVINNSRFKHLELQIFYFGTYKYVSTETNKLNLKPINKEGVFKLMQEHSGADSGCGVVDLVYKYNISFEVYNET